MRTFAVLMKATATIALRWRKGRAKPKEPTRTLVTSSRADPTGKGVYTWESGARLEGSFKEGKAHGPGVYVSAKGMRYEGQFVNGKLDGLKTADCPSTPGPLSC